MAYYCRKCRRWHTGGAIAQRHKIFSARPKRSKFRPQTTKPRQTRKIKQNKPIKALTIKKKPARVKTPAKPKPMRKAKIGLSKMRRGQLAMRPQDQYEKSMVKRLRSKTGMTHVQVMNLVNLAKKSDYIDIETEIASASGLSRDKTETYEFAKKNIMKKLHRSGDVQIQSKYNDPDFFDQMQEDWQRQQEWEAFNKKWRKKNNLVPI